MSIALEIDRAIERHNKSRLDREDCKVIGVFAQQALLIPTSRLPIVIGDTDRRAGPAINAEYGTLNEHLDRLNAEAIHLSMIPEENPQIPDLLRCKLGARLVRIHATQELPPNIPDEEKAKKAKIDAMADLCAAVIEDMLTSRSLLSASPD